MSNPLRSVQPSQTKNKIILAAEKLLRNNSIQQITIREICKTAEISVGTFYIYFSCKEECILQTYRTADSIFQNLELCDDPFSNIEIVIKTMLSMVDFENLDFDRQLYICHLSYYDSYFFDETRELFVIIKHQLRIIKETCDTHQITWEILEYCRGKIYNFLISRKNDGEKWISTTIKNAMNYLKFLINQD